MNNAKLSEELLKDLFIILRANLLKWSKITNQTPQARMGYVGQHLTSIVTGYKGGKSGARGRDLLIGKSEFGEIKTCYRIDQLGTCLDCKKQVASFELECLFCGGNSIERKDDSKWLITIKDEKELKEIFEPKEYFLVLFEFIEFNNPKDINVFIYTVDPNTAGFSLCMIDYFFNIRSKSTSKAPFNLWPHQFKFFLMKPKLIYHSIIKQDDTITTKIFPKDNNSKLIELGNLSKHSRSTTLTLKVIEDIYKFFKSENRSKDKETSLKILQEILNKKKITNSQTADLLSNFIYKDVLIKNKKFVPNKTLEEIKVNLDQI
jgi:hypothetical protein